MLSESSADLRTSRDQLELWRPDDMKDIQTVQDMLQVKQNTINYPGQFLDC